MSANELSAEPPDAVIVARIRAGEPEAFRVVVRRHQDMLYRHALRLTGSGDAAADEVQQAFVKAFQQLASCRDPDRFGAWVFRILDNGCKDFLKSRRRKDVRLDQVEAAVPPSPHDPHRDLERAELGRALDEALRRLPESQRTPFLMKHAEGRSYEEMSEMLGDSVPSLKMRVHRAREMLKLVLQEVV